MAFVYPQSVKIIHLDFSIAGGKKCILDNKRINTTNKLNVICVTYVYE